MEPVPFDKRSGKIWYNGKLVDWKEANLHILSHGLHLLAACLKAKGFTMGKFLS